MPDMICPKKQTATGNFPSSHNEDGFTLLEMLVVMTIIMGVFAGLSNTIARRNNTPSLEAMAKSVQTLAYKARSDAIGSGDMQSVWVDIENKLFSYANKSPVQIPKNVSLKITTGQELISAGGRIELVFLADGSSSGMDVVFSEVNAKDGEAGQNKSVKLRINWLTGLPIILESTFQ